MPSLFQAALAATSLATACGHEFPTFESFIALHQRTYQTGSAEFQERQALYQQRKADSELHNSDANRLWNAGVNKLWDWTEAELKTLRGWDGSMMPAGGSGRSIHKHATFLQQATELPETKSWIDLGTGQHIRNQGDCGSCWAIAVSTVLEGHAEIAGKPRTFSAQQIVECTPNPRHCGGDGGCKGATAELAMDFVLKNGVDEAANAPYTAADDKCTRGSPSSNMGQMFLDDSATTAVQGGAAFGMMGWETLPKNEYEPLVRAIAEKGPVAVSVAADAWFNYENGIFNGCGKDAVIDHAVVAMGYGSDGGNKYWIIQNSWGKDWGEAGHIRLERHDQGDYCGMNSDPQKGVACQGETAPVPVCGMCGVLFDSVVPHFSR